jgi:phosphoglycolate phosphatase-like HAD superfamily hydrolase
VAHLLGRDGELDVPIEEVLVGDRLSDVQAASRAGLRSILIGSGAVCQPRPNLVVASLREAVSAILAGRLSQI